MSLFKNVADIQTADMLKLPVPEAHYHNIALKPSEYQKQIVASLAERAEKVRNREVDSRVDNMLLITNDGRKLALDQRLVNPMLPSDPDSKAAKCAENVFEIWQRTADQRSTQMIFCDLSTPGKERPIEMVQKEDGSFGMAPFQNVYEDIRTKLIELGVPENEIAFIHNAKSEVQKKDLFGKVRNGQVRILLGSTQRMGAGTNCQQKLVALHHLDCPWRPSDLQQREGRIIRQGNENKEVDIYSYVTEGTFDAYLYQLVESKQKFISQIMTSKSPVRSAEDVDEQALSYAEIKALASGNPLIKEKMDLDIEVSKLKLLKSNHLSQRYALEDAISKTFPKNIAEARERISGYEADIVAVKENTHPNADGFSPLTLMGVTYAEKKEAGAALLTMCQNMLSPEAAQIGSYTITTYVNANEKVLTKNPLYWDTDCTLFDSVTYKMVESKDVAFQMFQAGEVDDITLTESNLHTIYDNPSNEYHDNLVESRPTKFSYQIHFCWDKYLENGEPDTNWNTAIANESFRKAWYYGLDLTPYLARTNYINPQNCANYAYTMSNLVSFSDGTEYTQRVMDKLGIKADGTSFARYDAAKADEYKSKAIEELTAKGVTFPVEIDYYIKASDQTALDNANVMKQMFSDCLGDDFVTFNIKTYVSSVAKEVRNPQLASFYVNAWGADYGDPQNFLGQETYGDDNAWYSTAYSKANNITDPELLAVYQKFTAMVEKASNTTDDMDARYEAYADAEAYMLDKVITLPLYKVVSWEMTHVNDYSKIYAPYGIQINKFKNWETSVDLYTTEDYAKLAAIYEANAAK